MTIKEDRKTFEQRSKLIFESTYKNFIYESEAQKKKRINELKKDVVAFVNYYLPHYATSESAQFQIKLANDVKKDEKIKVIVRWGRGLAKSVWSDVIIPLWLWINEDINYMVIVGNNYDKAKILLSDLQAEYESNQRLIDDFGGQMMHGSWEDGYFRTKSGFIAKALGMGQSPRGLRLQAQRPDYIVSDDLEDKDIVRNPQRQDQVVEWIEQDLLPTMDGQKRRYLHPNNNYAPRTIQEELRLRHPEWKVSRIDAYDNVTYQPAWIEKYNSDYYKEIEKEIGVLAARAEYNNQPHIEGKPFSEKQIQWAKLPRINAFRIIVGFWDVAYAGNSTSDYNAVRVWGLYDNDYYYINSFVKQTKIQAAVEWMADYQKQLPESVVIHWRYESQFWNDEVDRIINEIELKNNIILNISKVNTPKTKKYDRMLSMQPMYQNGRVYYNEKKKNHNSTIQGLQQLYGLEPGYRTHDDAPDADQQAIQFLTKYIRINSTKPRTGQYKRNKKRQL